MTTSPEYHITQLIEELEHWINMRGCTCSADIVECKFCRMEADTKDVINNARRMIQPLITNKWEQVFVFNTSNYRDARDAVANGAIYEAGGVIMTPSFISELKEIVQGSMDCALNEPTQLMAVVMQDGCYRELWSN